MDGLAVDDNGVRRSYSDDYTESVRWSEVERVEIRTTGDGPAKEDLFFFLHGSQDTGVVVPNCMGDKEREVLFKQFLRLPGFKNDEFRRIAEATGSSDDATFDIWRRSPSRDAGF